MSGLPLLQLVGVMLFALFGLVLAAVALVYGTLALLVNLCLAPVRLVLEALNTYAQRPAHLLLDWWLRRSERKVRQLKLEQEVELSRLHARARQQESAHESE